VPGAAGREIVQLLARGLVVTKRLIEKAAIRLFAQARKQRRDGAFDVSDQPHCEPRTIAEFFAANVHLRDARFMRVELSVWEIGP